MNDTFQGVLSKKHALHDRFLEEGWLLSED